MLLDKYTHTNTLYLTIGLKNIEYGVFASGNWIKDSISKKVIDIDPIENSAVTKLALAILEIATDIENWSINNPSLTIKHLSVLVADIWLPSTSIPWNSSSISNDNLANAFAINQLGYAGFDVEPTDSIKFLEHSYGKPSLAVVYPRSILDSFRSLANILKLELTSILPFSIAAWHVVQASENQVPIFGLFVDNLLIVGDFSNGMGEIKTLVLDEEAKDCFPLIETEWKRIKLRASHLGSIESLPLFNLSQLDNKVVSLNKDTNLLNILLDLDKKNISPSLSLAQRAGGITSSVNAISSKNLLTPLNWMVISILLTCVSFLGTQLWQLHQQVKHIDSNIVSLQTVRLTSPLNNTWTKQELEQAKSINATIRQLNLPFATFMGALQPPRDIRVAILSLDIDAKDATATKTSHIKIVAEAKTAGEMANYVSFLSHRKIFKGVFLVSHEIDESIPEHPYKFNIELLWENQS